MMKHMRGQFVMINIIVAAESTYLWTHNPMKKFGEIFEAAMMGSIWKFKMKSTSV